MTGKAKGLAAHPVLFADGLTQGEAIKESRDSVIRSVGRISEQVRE
jgi:hypothetical protein